MPAMPSADVRVYRSLARTFRRLRARWYLFGAQAAILHGAVRFTEDVDVTVAFADRPRSALIDALRRERFHLRVDDEDFVEQTRVFPLLHEPTGTPVDVVLAGPGLEEMFLEACVEIDIEGLKVPVASAEDVVVMKVLSARPKDIEDVVAILGARGSAFDGKRVRRLLDQLEGALGQSDLVSLYERCRARASGSKRSARAKRRTRDSNR